MKGALSLSAFLFALLLQVPPALCQQLAVQGDTGKEVNLSRAEIEALPRVEVRAQERGESVKFEGIALNSVLEKAGVEFGDSLRGARFAEYLLVEAADGYRVVFALPELDPAFTDKRIVLAASRNGNPLDNKEGAVSNRHPRREENGAMG